MKKFFKVLGIIILVLIIAAAALAVWQWKYVKAFFDGMRYDEQALGEQQLKAAEKTVEDVNSYFTASLREMTDEEKEKIASGELSQSALLAKIISEATGVPLEGDEEPVGPVAENAPDGEASSGLTSSESGGEETGTGDADSGDGATSGGEAVQTQPNADQIVAVAVSKLYSLQSQYTGQIDSLVARAKAYYKEQKAANGTAAARSSTLAAFSGEVVSMESACDAKVEAVLSDLTAQLNAIGADTSIVATLRSSYNSEKSAQRAAYVSKYMK